MLSERSCRHVSMTGATCEAARLVYDACPGCGDTNLIRREGTAAHSRKCVCRIKFMSPHPADPRACFRDAMIFVR